jgi:hypothetical protein
MKPKKTFTRIIIRIFISNTTFFNRSNNYKQMR